MKCRRFIGLSAIAVLGVALLPHGATGQQKSLRDQLIGSWYLVASDDRMIPPAAQRLMSRRAGATVVEVAASHAVYVSQPEVVTRLIADAARGVSSAESVRERVA